MNKVEKQTTNEIWLTSQEAQKALKVSGCHLMHMRLAGKLKFRKEGNRFFYMLPKQIET